MLKIHFSELAVSEIKKFIQLYEEGFYILYKDSGIWSKDIIIEQYRQTAKNLNNLIFLGIENKLKKKKVLGRKQANRWNEITFHVNDRLIIIYFSDDLKNKIRWVESVGIDRKPIIF